VSEDFNYECKELICYSFVVTNPETKILAETLDINVAWCEIEFDERVSPQHLNPGDAWKSRPEVWKDFLVAGKFAYTYNERMHLQMRYIKRLLLDNPDTRQAVIAIYDGHKDAEKLGIDRVPCSMYYQFLMRDGKLNLHYVMRSCDLATHFQNDVYLAACLLEYMCSRTGFKLGDLYVTIGSLHVFRKDWDKGQYLEEGDENV
jgi:thymidylate synthase